MQGTIALTSARLRLRRYMPGDAEILYKDFGTDEKMFAYSGWNPYATREQAQATVDRFIANYQDCHFYGWAIECGEALVGTVGAYDYDPEQNSIEVGLSIKQAYWGRGYAGETLQTVLAYLTEQEGIRAVTAWCASENIGSKRVMEKCGMRRDGVERNALSINGHSFDKLNYTYRAEMKISE